MVQLNNIYMSPFLQINRFKDFNKDILPQIETFAIEQSKSRSDVIRNILYTKFDYEPKARLQDLINKDYIEEKQKEKELNYCYIVIKVDNAYRDMFYTNMIAYPGNLGRNCNCYFNQALYEYLGLEVPEKYSFMKFDKPIIKPKYPTRIRIANLFEGNNINPDSV